MVKYISDWIGVMYYGKILEIGFVDEVYNYLLYKYIESLILVVLVFDLEFECNCKQVFYDEMIEYDGKKW